MTDKLQDHFDKISKILEGFGVECTMAYKEITIAIRDQRDIHLILGKLKKNIALSSLQMLRL